MQATELKKVEAYLQKTFGNASIRVQARPKKDDSAEVYVGEEFVGLIYYDEEEGDYNFNMAILDFDLEDI